MGLGFRDNRYLRFVRIGKRTVKEGECCQIWNVNGKLRTVIGPRLVRLWLSTVRFCTRYTAQLNQYLEIEGKDGVVTHIKGPCSMFFNHSLHETINVKDALHVEYGEAIVVYTQNLYSSSSSSFGEDKLKTTTTAVKVDGNKTSVNRSDSISGSMTRHIQLGPCMFFPEVNQRLHHFNWHGETKASHPSEVRVLAGERKFHKLPLLEQQLYYNVRDVKTADNNSLTIKLMLFYTISDLHKMLDSTNDPVGDMANAICADVVAWAASRSYSNILEQTSDLSKLHLYGQLMKCTEICGVRIGKVVYRGYKGSSNMEQMHSQAAKRRLELISKQEAAEERERLEEFKLVKMLERAERQREKETADIIHQQNLERRVTESSLKREQMAHEQLMRHTKEKTEQELAYLNRLRNEGGVNLTKYLVSRSYGESKSKHHMIHVENNDSSGNIPPLHLHAGG